jgi:hypothetical protein
MNHLRDRPSTADTAIATLALMRSGSTPAGGEYAKSIRRAVEFLIAEVETADRDSLYITSVRGTRVQSKLGPFIDTFLTALVFSEVRGRMPDPASNQRLNAALDKVMDKIERNQRHDGTWDSTGWAPVLSQAMAAKAVNRAALAGARVKEETRARTESYARRQFDTKSGNFAVEGAAGVPLYSSAGNLGALQDAETTNRSKERDLYEKLEKSKDENERKSTQAAIDRIQQNRRVLAEARTAVAAKLSDASFVQGFGSNGGEEFLSYMNIGESLAAQGGPEFERWQRTIAQSLSRVQNQDGTWTGHHCITGRTFCTSAALLVLTLDHSTAPLANKMRRR